MRNLRPIGVPHSIFLENLFARTYDASKLEEDAERVRLAYHDRGYFRGHRRRAAHPHPQRGRPLASLPSGRRRASASTSPCPSKKASAIASAASPSPATRRVSNVKALRAQFAMKDGDFFN